MRPDAERWVRQDAARFLRVDTDVAAAFPSLAKKFNPNQPRIPSGKPGGGRWTSEEEGSNGNPFGFLGENNLDESAGEIAADNLGSADVIGNTEDSLVNGAISDQRVISDVDPETVAAGEQYAQANNRRGGGTVIINGQQVELTPAQGARLAAAQANAEEAVSRIREIDPTWKPPSSMYQTAEGLIRAYQSDALAAQVRAGELASQGLLPGPFSGKSIPARNTGRNFTAAERSEINRIGSETGCNTCGTRDPGTKSGNFVIDHQIPSALNFSDRAQRLYPQCLTCSLTQGGWVTHLKGKR